MIQETLIHVCSGIPELVEVLPAMNPNRLGVMARFWEFEHAFSQQASYEYRIREEPTISWVQRVAAHLVYNPKEEVKGEWVKTGPYSKDTLVALVKRGLESDDDIIQQWFPGDEVIRLLGAASSFQQMLLAVDAVCGGQETNAETRKYVEQILGSREPVE